MLFALSNSKGWCFPMVDIFQVFQPPFCLAEIPLSGQAQGRRKWRGGTCRSLPQNTIEICRNPIWNLGMVNIPPILMVKLECFTALLLFFYQHHSNPCVFHALPRKRSIVSYQPALWRWQVSGLVMPPVGMSEKARRFSSCAGWVGLGLGNRFEKDWRVVDGD